MSGNELKRTTMELPVKVAQEFRTVRIWSFGDRRWYLDANDVRHAGVIFRFRTGGKHHLLKSPQVFIRGSFGVVLNEVIHNRPVAAVRWAKPEDNVSKWSQ